MATKPPGDVLVHRAKPVNRKYTPELHVQIVKKIKKGSYRGQAAMQCGISGTTLSDWLQKAAAEREMGVLAQDLEYPEYRTLLEDIEKVEAQFEQRMVGKVVKAAESEAPNTWQAAMTLLERKHPERWGRRDTSKIVVEGGERPIQVETRSIIFDETSRGLSRDLLKRLAASGSGEPSGVRVGDGSADDGGTVESEATEVAADEPG